MRPPETEPPQSTAPGHGPVTRPAPVEPPAAPVQTALPLLFTLPSGTPARPASRPALRLVSHRVPTDHPTPRSWSDEEDDRDATERTPRSALPDPRRWAAALVQAAVEARQGDRPVAQLVRWTTREVYDRLAREVSAPNRSDARDRRRTVRPVIRSLHVSEPEDGVVEACSVVHDGTRGRAIALRMEGRGGRWVCTALDVL